MESGTLFAIFRTSVAEVEAVIDSHDLDAQAKQLGRFVAVWGPTVDDLGVSGIQHIARDKRLPLVAVRRKGKHGSQPHDKAM